MVLSLVATCLLACGNRGGGESNSGRATGEGEVVPAAIAPAQQHDAAGVAGECVMSTPFALAEGTGNVLGVWREPSMGALYAASPNPRASNEVVVRRASLPDGALSIVRTITAPAGSTVQNVWRAFGGDMMVGYRVGNSLRLGRDDGSGFREQALTGYYTPSRDRSIGPVDDPSESHAIGVLSEATGYIAYASLCVTSVGPTPTLLFCSHYWPNTSTARRLNIVPGALNSASPMAQAHTYGGPTSTVVVTRGGSYSWEPLGRLPGGSGTGVPRYGYGYTRRSAITDTSRGGPMAAPSVGGAVVAWVNERGAVEVQAVSAAGTANADPVTLPFVDASLEDLVSFGGEVLMTLTTRADRTAHPATTTFVRLSQSLDRAMPVTIAPVRVSVAGARITTVSPSRLVLWSPSAGNAVSAECHLSGM